MHDNRLPQTSPQETDMAMWGDWESETHLYSNIKRNTYSLCCRYNHPYPCKHIKQLYFILGKKLVIRGKFLSIIETFCEHKKLA